MSAPRSGAPLQVMAPDWPAPPAVRAAFTLRMGGVSAAPFNSLNVGAHVGDAAAAVTENSRCLHGGKSMVRASQSQIWAFSRWRS